MPLPDILAHLADPTENPACTCWRGDPAKAPPCTCGHSNALMPENDAQPIFPPRAYILTREKAEDLVKACNGVLACGNAEVYAMGRIVALRETREFIELQKVVDGLNFDL